MHIGKSVLEITRHNLIADLARPLSAQTKQNHKRLYHTLFTWMQDEGFCADNPGARLPRTPCHRRTNPAP